MNESPKEAPDYAFFLLDSGMYRNFSAWSTFGDFIPRIHKTEGKILNLYYRLVQVYSKRDLTYDRDALNAIGAIFAKLRESGLFPGGFYWGFPLDRFDEALKWSWLRSPDVRRENFPSWSWLGWKGEIDPRVDDVGDVEPPVFSAWRLSGKKFERLAPGSTFDKDQIPEALLEAPTIIPWLSGLNESESTRLLVLRGYVLRLPVWKPFPSEEKSIRMPLFGDVAELLCGSDSVFSNIMALGREVTEYIWVLRVNIPESWGAHVFVLLDRACTADDADNSLTAEYAGWFRVIQNRFGIFGATYDSEIAIGLKVHQELRTVFLQ
jgi:hypothetical protein